MDRDRLRRIRNFQSQDWYPALVIRPLTILVMLAVADWRFLTPNRITTIANLCKLAGAALVVIGAEAAGAELGAATIAAAILLQLGLLLDHLDGTMARYRRAFTNLGSFYDKVSDLATWFVIALAVGWAAYRATGQAGYIALAALSSFALDIMGYMKWLIQAESERLRWLEARADPATHVARRTAPVQIASPPERSRRDWLVWLARLQLQLLRFEEMDLFFWVGLGLLLGRPDWLVWLLFISQTAVMISMMVRRARQAAAVDRRMRDLGG
jgi:phosphatidylglycerophosphate synthase